MNSTNYRKAKRGETPCGQCRHLVEPEHPSMAPRCPIHNMYAIGRKNTCDAVSSKMVEISVRVVE